MGNAGLFDVISMRRLISSVVGIGVLCALAAASLTACEPLQDTATPTPTPTATPSAIQRVLDALRTASSPEPAATVTPAPVPTSVPMPTATSTAEPTPGTASASTATPEATPEPTPAPTPTPTPSVSVVLEARAQLVGYWSDGTADVVVTVLVRNVGGRALRAFHGIEIKCSRGKVAVSECPENVTAGRSGGGLPGTEFTVRVPMGIVPLEVQLNADDGATTTIEVEVPERILGVSRHAWECYSDRPGHMNRCGGWTNSVKKWEPEKPIRVWAEGRQDYLVALEGILEQMSELLNHTFERVESEEQADLVVYVGLASNPGTCIGGSGCGGTSSGSGGDQYTVVGGETWVADLGDVVPRRVIAHELFHALIPAGHYPSPYHLLGAVEGLSAVDEAILRLHGHPLVKPGMTKEQVDNLIVFSDEMLDARPIDITTLVWRAREVLIEQGTAAFTSRGVCLADTASCHSHGMKEFGWTDHLIGEFRLPGNHFQKIGLQDGESRAYVAGKEFWIESVDGWHSVDWNEFLGATGWRPNYTSLLTVLENILLLAHDGDITASERPDGRIALESREGRALRLYSNAKMKLSLTLDKNTFRISAYTVTICRPENSSGCVFEIEAKHGEYGIDVTVPEPIRQSTPSPTRWEGLKGVTTLSSGFHHTCALTVDGSPICWGSNGSGQAAPPEGERFASISSGGENTCGLRLDGSAVCWGSLLGNDSHWRSRDGLWTSPAEANREDGYRAKPVTIMRFTTLSAGRSKTCAIRPDGSPFCWGLGGDEAPSEEVFTSISSGGRHICALHEDGSPTCWGDSRYWQATAPIGERFVSISSGGLHTCALRPDGTSICWGNDDLGQSSPPEGERFVSVSAGSGHTCGLRHDGTAVCWGRQPSPPESERFVSISSGAYHTCALREDGTAVCWGQGSEGRLSPPEGKRFAVGRVDGT